MSDDCRPFKTVAGDIFNLASGALRNTNARFNTLLETEGPAAAGNFAGNIGGRVVFELGSVILPAAKAGKLGKFGKASRFRAIDDLGDLAPGFHRADPARIRFGQHVASPNFSDGGTISDLVADLRAGLSPDAVRGGPIRVIIRDGQAFALDNRRLLALNTAGVKDIPIQVVTRRDPGISDLLRNPTRLNPIDGEGRFIVVAPGREQAAARQLLLERGRIN